MNSLLLILRQQDHSEMLYQVSCYSFQHLSSNYHLELSWRVRLWKDNNLIKYHQRLHKISILNVPILKDFIELSLLCYFNKSPLSRDGYIKGTFPTKDLLKKPPSFVCIHLLSIPSSLLCDKYTSMKEHRDGNTTCIFNVTR